MKWWFRNLVWQVGLVSLVSLGIGNTPIAHAQGKKKSSQDECKKDPNNPGCKKASKKETKVKAVKRKSTTKRPSESRDSGPGFSSSNIQATVRSERAKTRRKVALEVLDQLIERTPESDSERPELLFRKGETLYDLSKANYLSSRDLDDKVYYAKQDKDQPTVDKLQKQQKKLEDQAQDQRLAAFKAYIDIIKNHPSYDKRDEVLFYTGFNLKELAEQYELNAEILEEEKKRSNAATLRSKAKSYRAKTLDFYKQLIKGYPNSKFFPDALLEVAETYFHDEDMPTALRAYKALAAYKQSRVYGYSLYMQGWCHYNMGDYPKALQMFKETVEYSRAKVAAGDRGKATLEKEALKDVVRAYSKYGAPSKAKSFFQTIGGPDNYVDMLARLGGYYYEQGAFLDAIDIYEDIIAINPKSNDNHIYQYEVCIAALALSTQNRPGAQERIVTEMQTLSRMYQNMLKRNAPADKIATAKENTAAILMEVSTNWHATAQKTKDPKLYERAQYIYKEYNDSFPDAENSYTMTWNYAELLFQLGEMGDDDKWEDSAVLYQKVVQMNPKGKYLSEAAEASVIAYQNANRKLIYTVTPPTGDGSSEKKDNTPQAIPERQQRMLKAYQFLVEHDPKNKKAAFCKYSTAQIYWEYNHYDKALPVFRDIVENDKRSEFAGYAANILLDILKEQKKYDEFEKYVLEFKKDPILSKNPELSDNLDDLYAKVRGDQCQNFESQKMWANAAGCYAGLIEEFPESPNRKGAIYNAAITYENAKQIGRAMVYRAQLMNEYPESEEGQRAIYAIGRLYANIAVYGKAAAAFETFANKYPGEKNAIIALNDAAVFREGRGEFDLAVEDNKKYITIATRNKVSQSEIADAFFRIAEIRRKEGNAAKAYSAYEEYLRKYGKKGKLDNWLQARTRTAIYLLKRNKRRDKATALKQCREVIRTFDKMEIEEAKEKTSQSGRDAVAECSFYIAEEGYAAFESFKLPSNFSPKKLAAWYEGVKKTRETTSALYLNVRKYDSKDWTLAALARIGLMSYKFMDGLYKGKIPNVVTVEDERGRSRKLKVTQDLRDTYRDALDELAEPLRSDAITAFSACIEGSKQENWYNKWSITCEEYLNIISPAEYPISEEWKAEPTFEKPIVIPASVIKVLK